MASTAGEEGGATRMQVFNRAAIAALSAYAILTAIAGFLVLPHLAIGPLLQIAVPLPFIFACALALTRHSPLAAVVALAPATGILCSEALGLLFHAPLAAPSLALAFGALLALVQADSVVTRVLEGDEAKAAARAAALATWRPWLGGVVLAFAMLAVVVRDPWFRQISLSALLQFASSGIAAIVVLLGGTPLFSFSEAFVTRLNRVRETRTRRAYAVSLISMPRWGLSVSGVGLVAAVLGFFGAEGMLVRSGFAVPTVALLALFLSFGLSGRWRNALALMFAVSVTALIGFWSWTELRSHGLLDVIALIEAVAIGFALMLAVTSRERALGGVHNDSVARLLAIEELATPVVYVVLAIVVPALLLGGAGGLAAVVLASGAACALLLTPAATTAFETLVPRRKSVSELYSSHS